MDTNFSIEESLMESEEVLWLISHSVLTYMCAF